MSGAQLPPADYPERVMRCIKSIEAARARGLFQGLVLVAPDVLDECYACFWQYMNFVSPLTTNEPPVSD